MLKLYGGRCKSALFPAGGYFDNWVDENVVFDDFSRRAIKGVDLSDVMDDGRILSPVLGGIVPSQLSGGVKSLMVLKFTDKVVNLDSMGDNCFPYLAELGKVKDIVVSTDRHRMLFENGVQEVLILNDNSIVHSGRELFYKLVELGVE